MNRSSLTARWLPVLCGVMLSACAVDVDLETSPDPPVAGDPATLTVRARNNSSCTIPQGVVRILPFLTPADEAIINEELMNPSGGGISINFTVEQLCTLAGLPDSVVPMDTAGALRDPPSFLVAKPAPAQLAQAAVCAPMQENGIDFTQCIVGPLAPDQTIELQVTETVAAPGPLRSVVFAPINAPGVCGPTSPKAGEPCLGDVDCDAPDSCLEGYCDGGGNDGLGCDETTPCPDPGTCVSCDRCAVAGVCVAGDREGESCRVDDDCPSAERVIDICRCGLPYACDSVEAVAPTPTPPPPAGAPAVSDAGMSLAVLLLAMIGIAAIVRARVRRP